MGISKEDDLQIRRNENLYNNIPILEVIVQISSHTTLKTSQKKISKYNSSLTCCNLLIFSTPSLTLLNVK